MIPVEHARTVIPVEQSSTVIPVEQSSTVIPVEQSSTVIPGMPDACCHTRGAIFNLVTSLM